MKFRLNDNSFESASRQPLLLYFSVSTGEGCTACRHSPEIDTQIKQLLVGGGFGTLHSCCLQHQQFSSGCMGDCQVTIWDAGMILSTNGEQCRSQAPYAWLYICALGQVSLYICRCPSQRECNKCQQSRIAIETFRCAFQSETSPFRLATKLMGHKSVATARKLENLNRTIKWTKNLMADFLGKPDGWRQGIFCRTSLPLANTRWV